MLSMALGVVAATPDVSVDPIGVGQSASTATALNAFSSISRLVISRATR